MGFQRFKITFKENDGIYASGDLIEGNVFVESEEPKKATSKSKQIHVHVPLF